MNRSFFFSSKVFGNIIYNKDFWYKMCNVNDIDCIG